MSAPQFHASQINNAQRHSKRGDDRKSSSLPRGHPLGSAVGGRALKVAVVQLQHHRLGRCFDGLPMQPREPILRVLETRERILAPSRQQDGRRDAQTREHHGYCYGCRYHSDLRACCHRGCVVAFVGGFGAGGTRGPDGRSSSRLDWSSSLADPKRQHRRGWTRRCEFDHVWFSVQELTQSTRSAKRKETCAAADLQLTVQVQGDGHPGLCASSASSCSLFIP